MNSLRIKLQNSETFLLNNVVDKDVQSMILPLNILQNIFFYPKYRIKDNFINPNSFSSKLVSMLGMIAFSFLFLYRVFEIHHNKIIRTKANIVYLSSYFDFISNSLGFILNYTINVVFTKRNVSFVLKIQDVHRFLKDETYVRHFVKWNWISGFLIFFIYIFLDMCCCLLIQVPLIDIFCCLSLMSFDLNIVYAVRFIKLLSHKVDLWIIHAQYLQQMGASENKAYCRRMFQAYVNILECYDIYRSSFQEMASTYDFFVLSATDKDDVTISNIFILDRVSHFVFLFIRVN